MSSWNPGYSSTTNHYVCTGCTTDTSGNVTNDGTNAYTWDPFNKMSSINMSGTGCSSAGECLVYDALGHVVEIDNGSVYTEIWYTQLGKFAYMNGSTEMYAYWPAPGGSTTLYNGATYYMHNDWLGSSRIVSDVNASTVLSDRAFAPYGEIYDAFGSTSIRQRDFTGDTQDILSGMYDTPNRELQGSQQGRWLSPDPAGSGWNQYAYVTNPNSQIDPSGLECLIDCDDPSGWGGIDDGSGFGGIDGLSGNSCDPTDDPSCIFNPITPPVGSGNPGGGLSTPPQSTGGVWPNNETLCLPTALGTLFGSSGTQCGGDLSTFDPADLLSFTDCSCGDCACPRLPQIDPIEKLIVQIGVTGAVVALGAYSYGECLVQFTKDLNACREAYPPGPDRENCFEKAAQKFRLCKGGGKIQ